MCNERATMVVGARGLEVAQRLFEHFVYADTVVSTVDNALALCRGGIYGAAYVPGTLAAEFRERLEKEGTRCPDFIIEY